VRRWVHRSWRWVRGSLRRRNDGDGDGDCEDLVGQVLPLAVASSMSHLSSICKSCWVGLSSC
jgi:hypothetical protein